MKERNFFLCCIQGLATRRENAISLQTATPNTPTPYPGSSPSATEPWSPSATIIRVTEDTCVGCNLNRSQAVRAYTCRDRLSGAWLFPQQRGREGHLNPPPHPESHSHPPKMSRRVLQMLSSERLSDFCVPCLISLPATEGPVFA